MRLVTNLLTKVTLSSMILTAPAMRTGNTDDGGKRNLLPEKQQIESFYSAVVIHHFVDHPSVKAISAVMKDERLSEENMSHAKTSDLTAFDATASYALASDVTAFEATASYAKTSDVTAGVAPKEESKTVVSYRPVMSPEISASAAAVTASAKAAELRLVVNQAVILYASMNLEASGLDEKAFEYAWRGYHNLLKKRMIRKSSVLSICDFSQSSSSKRMYVIDVRHRRLLYRTYVAHGQNSGDEYASSFSNEPDSYKSSLGFYVTRYTYIGHNGLSLKLSGVDSGYNDMAAKRNIVLHGSSYVSDKYMQEFGTLGTSLGCPAIPSAVSGRIIRTVKGGSCLFIYHPTPQYLEYSSIING